MNKIIFFIFIVLTEMVNSSARSINHFSHLPDKSFMTDRILKPFGSYLRSVKKKSEIQDFGSGCLIMRYGGRHSPVPMQRLELCPLWIEKGDFLKEGIQFRNNGVLIYSLYFVRKKGAVKTTRSQLLDLKIDLKKGDFQIVIPEMSFFIHYKKEERERSSSSYEVRSTHRDFYLIVLNKTFSYGQKRSFEVICKTCQKTGLIEALALETGDPQFPVEYTYYAEGYPQTVTPLLFNQLLGVMGLHQVRQLSQSWIQLLQMRGFPSQP